MSPEFWFVQATLALAFLFHGGLRIVKLNWFKVQTLSAVIHLVSMAWLEIFASIGLLLPKSIALSAFALTLLMALGLRFHFIRKEKLNSTISLALLVLSAAVFCSSIFPGR